MAANKGRGAPPAVNTDAQPPTAATQVASPTQTVQATSSTATVQAVADPKLSQAIPAAVMAAHAQGDHVKAGKLSALETRIGELLRHLENFGRGLDRDVDRAIAKLKAIL